jgi:hypothetical protein
MRLWWMDYGLKFPNQFRLMGVDDYEGGIYVGLGLRSLPGRTWSPLYMLTWLIARLAPFFSFKTYAQSAQP